MFRKCGKVKIFGIKCKKPKLISQRKSEQNKFWPAYCRIFFFLSGILSTETYDVTFYCV
jgi:hypothetical protein